MELISNIVEARIQGALDPLRGGDASSAGSAFLEGRADEAISNASRPILDGPKRVLLRTSVALKALLGKNNPGLWLFMTTVYLTHTRSRLEKSSDIRDIRTQLDLGKDYHIAIVTTAALPWMTGTAVNPLLRAAHLAKAGKRVTLMVPWLHKLEQRMIFPNSLSFDTPEEQEAHIREWISRRGGLRSDFRLAFYPGRYDIERGSILPLGDITRFFEHDESDICVLEEPEHLTWYHNGPNWRHRFKLVVGVVHTNYIYYAKSWSGGGPLAAATLQQINWNMCQAYCDKVIKLSDTLQPLPRAVVCNVHGVRADFLEIGRKAAFPLHRWKKGAYFLGKALWAKGHKLLFDYLELERQSGEAATHIDLYGKGEDLEDITAAAEERQLDLSFFGPTDHAGPTIRDYKVFVNPSQSEVLSTTIAEALAMGKFVVIERHPSNDFFMGFRNTLAYDTPEEFLQQLRHALASTPAPLSPEERRALSWEGATERFLSAVTDSSHGSTLPSFGDHTARWVHQGILKGGIAGDAMRYMSGAGPVSRQSWLPKYRDAEVTEIVDMSVKRQPPVAERAPGTFSS